MGVTFDIFNTSALDAAVTVSPNPNRFQRGGVIEGIDVSAISGSPKSESLFLAQREIVAAANADAFIVNHPEYIPKRVILQGAVSDTAMQFTLIYETIVFGIGIPPSTYVLTDSTILTTRQSGYFINSSGNRRRVILAWQESSQAQIDSTGGSPGDDAVPNYGIPADIVNGSMFYPLRVIQVDALIYGRPPQKQQTLRKLNNAAWPAVIPTLPGVPDQTPESLPIAYWMMSEFTTRLATYSGYFTLSCKAVSRVDEDWSELEILRDTKTGRFVQVGYGSTVASAAASGDAIIDAMFAKPYVNDIIYGVDPADASRDVGCARVGRYGLTSFTDIFGFIWPLAFAVATLLMGFHR